MPETANAAFTKCGRAGLLDGRIIIVVDGVGGPWYTFAPDLLDADGRKVGDLWRSDRAVNFRLAEGLYTIPLNSFRRVVRDPERKAPVFQVRAQAQDRRHPAEGRSPINGMPSTHLIRGNR